MEARSFIMVFQKMRFGRSTLEFAGSFLTQIWSVTESYLTDI
jgi:hypothetical protein